MAIGKLVQMRQGGPSSEQIALCRDVYEALRLSLQFSNTFMPDEEWAEVLGCSRGNFAHIRNYNEGRMKRNGQLLRRRHIPAEWYPVIAEHTGNTALTDWLVMSVNGQLECQRTLIDKEQDLRRQLAEIEKQKAG